MTEPTTHRKSGTKSNTSLWLEPFHKRWLKQTFGGYQPGIRELIEAAMTGTKPRLEKLRRRQTRKSSPDKAKGESE